MEKSFTGSRVYSLSPLNPLSYLGSRVRQTREFAAHGSVTLSRFAKRWYDCDVTTRQLPQNLLTAPPLPAYAAQATGNAPTGIATCTHPKPLTTHLWDSFPRTPKPPSPAVAPT